MIVSNCELVNVQRKRPGDTPGRFQELAGDGAPKPCEQRNLEYPKHPILHSHKI